MKTLSAKTAFILMICIVACIFIGGSLFLTHALPTKEMEENAVITEPVAINPVEEKFGFQLDAWIVDEKTLKPNDFLSVILQRADVPYGIIDQLARASREVFDVRNFRAGKPYALVRDSCGTTAFFVYEPSPYRYILYKTTEPVEIRIVEREVEKCIESSSGKITSSLWVAMEETGHQWDLIAKMEDALAWSVDFHHLRKEDAFKLIFERNYIDGEPVGIGRLLGAYFHHHASEVYAIYFENPKYKGFYDEEGRPLKKAFLLAPVKYSRISSRFSYRRFHPVLKRYKAHFGTDYAAPAGTPIVAVADGIVTRASYTRGNGNYVKIRHDDVYESQYLHMQRFAKGIRPGVAVRQNQVIGYVGATGLATGPHVCFRFWKNGKQVDHLRQNLPPPEPMPEEALPEFFTVRDSIVQLLKAIPVISAGEAAGDALIL